MANHVLVVSRSSPKDFCVLAAQLSTKDLNIIGATVLKVLVESGANLHTTLELLRCSTKIMRRDLNVPMPLLIGGNRE